MATMAPFARAFAGLAIAIVVVACQDDGPNTDACAPGDFVRVALADGGSAFEQCGADGGGYVPFAGDPNLPIDASADAGACDTSGANLGAYMCIGCADDSQCATGLSCIAFPSRGGPHCTAKCTSDADCPPPAQGCGTNNGHCRP
jgi:hypothetical protein